MIELRTPFRKLAFVLLVFLLTGGLFQVNPDSTCEC